ncbi:MAG TPA: carboxymuconolactone decarboxylase family protein [Dehalococcoidia bacterium]|jgi:4-carboxymuconolactone decarboxylase|nr:carboxymuconolactone decarboxylase family protein [Dehalococcoidia bacterium]
MARVPNVTREQLSPQHHEFYDSIAGSRGSVRGPYGVLMHSPDLAARVAHTGSYVRFDLDLLESLKETVIITAAREIKNQYEFAAHARLARQHGVPEETIQAIARGTAPEGLPPDAVLLVKYAKELLQNHKVSDATFNAVKDKYGIPKTVEITALIGHYLLVGQILTAFEVDLPEGAKAEIPD